MRTPRLILAALVAAVTAGLAALPNPAGAAPGDGTLSVTMLDANGDPMVGAIDVHATDMSYVAAASPASTLDVPLPPGTYGVYTLSPYGGLLCEGMAPCTPNDVQAKTAQTDGTVVVTADQTTEVTVQAPVPAQVTGTPRVGRTLTVDFAPGLQELIDVLNPRYEVQVEWLRDGKLVSGASGPTYEITPLDAGSRITVRLAYTGRGQFLFTNLTGAPVPPEPLAGRFDVPRLATRATSVLPRGVRAGVRAEMRVRVSSPGAKVSGKVKVVVDGWSVVRPLRDGSARVDLPALDSGRHRVKARYLGSSRFAASSAPTRTLTVG